MMKTEASMFMLSRLSRFWAESRPSPHRARLLYAAFALGFVGLAAGGIARGDAVVIALGLLLALVASALAVLAPRLSTLKRDEARES